MREDMHDEAEDQDVTDEQDERIKSILGDYEEMDHDDAVTKYAKYLKANLDLPCTVTGLEDFAWEETFVWGGGDEDEYEEEKKTLPSYEDEYEILEICHGKGSEWMMFDDDIAVRVMRTSDQKDFILGLSELEVVDQKLPQYQLLDDYSCWFVNNR